MTATGWILPVFSVALGGAIGAAARYGLVLFWTRFLSGGAPMMILLINIAGCLLIGLVAGLLARHPALSSWQPFLMSGLLGGFTTFSTFALDAYNLYERGQSGLAVGYLLSSVVLGLVALIAGFFLARQLVA